MTLSWPIQSAVNKQHRCSLTNQDPIAVLTVVTIYDKISTKKTTFYLMVSHFAEGYMSKIDCGMLKWALVSLDPCLPTITVPSCDQALNYPSHRAWHAKLNWMSVRLFWHQYNIAFILLILSDSLPLLFAFGLCLSFPSHSQAWARVIIAALRRK